MSGPEEHTRGFVQLPSELVFEIAESFLDWDSTLNLAQTCRRLNDILIPELLRKHNLKPEGQDQTLPFSTLQESRISTVRLITAAMLGRNWPTDIRRLCCTFSTNRTYILTHLNQLAGLVDTLQSLQSILLDFGPARNDARSNSIESCIRAFEQLFNSIVEKGVSSITITGTMDLGYRDSFSIVDMHSKDILEEDPWLEASVAKDVGGDSQNFATTLKGRMWHWNFPRNVALPTLSLAAKGTCASLTTLRIDGLTMLKPPCSEWILSVIKHASSLETLILQKMIAEFHFWLRFIPLLASCLGTHQSIRRFRLHGVTCIPISALLWLLSKLHYLKILELGPACFMISPIAEDVLSAAPISFPMLEILEAPSDYISFFMLSRKCDLSALREIWIYPRVEYRPRLTRESSLHLTPIIRHFASQCQVIGIRGPVDSKTLRNPQQGLDLSKRLTHSSAKRRFKELLTALSVRQSSDKVSPPKADLPLCFEHVTDLELYSDASENDLGDWLSSFPNAKRIRFRRLGDTPSNR